MGIVFFQTHLITQIPFKLDLRKRVAIRIVAVLFVAFLFLFFKSPFTSMRQSWSNPIPSPSPSDVLNRTPIHSPPTVTVTEQLTVTVPIRMIHTQTKTVTTTSTKTNSNSNFPMPTSTITLSEITSSINIPKATFIPRKSDVVYKYAFIYDDNKPQLFLESERSVILRLPGFYRESPFHPKLHISITKWEISPFSTEWGNPIVFDVREVKKNDLISISWKETTDMLEIKVWTESSPWINSEFIVDYSEPFLDPRLWEVLENSQKQVWKKIDKASNEIDRRMKSISKKWLENMAKSNVVGDSLRFAQQFQEDVLNVADRGYQTIKDSVPKWVYDAKRSSHRIKDSFQRRMEEAFCIAQKQAVRMKERVENKFGGKRDWEKEWHRNPFHSCFRVWD
jgi:hypothetical protein